MLISGKNKRSLSPTHNAVYRKIIDCQSQRSYQWEDISKMNGGLRVRRISISIIVLVVILLCILLLSSCSLALESKMKALLQKAYNLKPGYSVGDKDFYHIETIYLEMDEAGKVAQTIALDGCFSREVKSIEKGTRTDNFLWKCVKRGSSKGKKEINEYKILPFTKGFQYTFGEWKPRRFPVDLSLIPKTMEGWRFVVKLIDAHTFDVIVNSDSYEEKLVHVGDSARLPGEGMPIAMDFPPLFTDTCFKNAPFSITFRGVTLHRDEPCAILAFRSDDCRVHLVVNMNNMKLPIDGVSYYFGEVLLSLEDRKIVWGKIIERVDSMTSLPTLGTPMRQVIRREITLERMDRVEY